MRFATGPGTAWPRNFRDLNAAVTRMATLVDGGRISEQNVVEEIERLRDDWRAEDDSPGTADLGSILPAERLAELDRFDRVQLQYGIGVCRRCRSLSEAGRHLYDVSRTRRTLRNDANRLRKFSTRCGLD